jgi:hypothetical protein
MPEDPKVVKPESDRLSVLRVAETGGHDFKPLAYLARAGDGESPRTAISQLAGGVFLERVHAGIASTKHLVRRHQDGNCAARSSGATTLSSKPTTSEGPAVLGVASVIVTRRQIREPS